MCLRSVLASDGLKKSLVALSADESSIRVYNPTSIVFYDSSLGHQIINRSAILEAMTFLSTSKANNFTSCRRWASGCIWTSWRCVLIGHILVLEWRRILWCHG